MTPGLLASGCLFLPACLLSLLWTPSCLPGEEKLLLLQSPSSSQTQASASWVRDRELHRAATNVAVWQLCRTRSPGTLVLAISAIQTENQMYYCSTIAHQLREFWPSLQPPATAPCREPEVEDSLSVMEGSISASTTLPPSIWSLYYSLPSLCRAGTRFGEEGTPGAGM